MRPLGRPRRRWEDLKDIGITTGNWVDLAQGRDYWRDIEPPGSIIHGVSYYILFPYDTVALP